MAKIDAARIREIFSRLGDALVRPTTLCLIGSAPGIATGQPGRQTVDVDVWHPASAYDASDLEQACWKVGLLYDPPGELEPNAVYLQLVRPGIVHLPPHFEIETIDHFGNLTITMPAPEILVAAKLTRGSDVDIEDAVWWVGQRAIDVDAIDIRIRDFPALRDRETASENLILLRLTKE